MSIVTEITRINTNIANSYTAVDNKNGTLPQVQNSANLASAIDSIEVIESATAEGESLSLANTKAMPYNNFVVEGKSEQDGEPSPSIPSEIHSVADDVNLFDKGNYTITYGGAIGFDVSNFEIGKQYTFSSKEPLQCIKISNSSDGYASVENYVYNGFTNFTFTMARNPNIPSSETQYIFIALTGYNFITDINDITNYNIKLQKGTEATPYSPYNQGTVTIKQSGKNLWNEELENAEYDTNGNKSTSTIWLVNKQGIEVNPNTTYTVSQQQKPSQYRIIFFNNNTYLDRINNVQNTTEGYKNYTFTTPANCNKIYIQFRSIIENINQGSYVMIPSDITNIQLEQGSTATPYEPYQGYDKVFQTEPLRSLPNGVKDTIEADGIHRRVGRIVLNGSESYWQINWEEDENHRVFQCINILSDSKKHNSSTTDIICQSTHYQATHFDGGAGSIWSLRNNDDYPYLIAVNDKSQSAYVGTITIKHQGISTLADFQTWLSTHNTEVLYELAEEIIEPLTQNQATTMLDIIKTGSYEGTTNIYTDEDVKPTIGVGYYKKG